MASLPPLPPGAGPGPSSPGGPAGGTTLDSPPPTAGNPPLPGQPNAPSQLLGGMDAAGAGGGAGPDEALQGLLNLGINLEELLLSLSQELPDSAEEFGRAKDLIKVGIAKVLVAAGGSPNGGPLPSNGPTESGKQFPAAGFNSPPSLNFG